MLLEYGPKCHSNTQKLQNYDVLKNCYEGIFIFLCCRVHIRSPKWVKIVFFWIFGQIQYVLYVRITHYLRWNMYSKCISSQIFPKLIQDVVLGNRKLDLIWKSKVFYLLRTIVNLYREFSQLPPLKRLKMQP